MKNKHVRCTNRKLHMINTRLPIFIESGLVYSARKCNAIQHEGVDIFEASATVAG